MMKRVTLRLPRSSGELDQANSSLCDISAWNDPQFKSLAQDIMGPNEPPIEHRKLWEFTKTVQALKELGVWGPDSLGISTGAGAERILFYAANNIGHIVATDIYGIGSFASRESSDSFLQNPKAHSPYPFDDERLSVLWMNALDLKFSDNLFDFACSFSSIEHFGGFDRSLASIKEMGRTVRPGGIVAFTTDCSLNGICASEVFSVREIRELCRQSGLDLAIPLHFSISERSQNYICDMLSDDLNALPHMNLKYYGSIFTSVLCVLRKPGDSPLSYDLRLKRMKEEVQLAKNRPEEDLRFSPPRPSIRARFIRPALIRLLEPLR